MAPLDRLLAETEQTLVRDGWAFTRRAKTSDENGNWTTEIDVEHPLSGGHGLFIDEADERTSTARLAAFFAKREFNLVRSRPRPMPHEALIGSLRKMMRGHSLGQGEMISLARILHAHGVITDEEESWLEAAGPACDYEAWQVVGGSPQHLIVCMPGGGLAVWDSSHVPTEDEARETVDRLNEMLGWNSQFREVTKSGGILVDPQPDDDPEVETGDD